jgi:hypothetical protein
VRLLLRVSEAEGRPGPQTRDAEEKDECERFVAAPFQNR